MPTQTQPVVQIEFHIPAPTKTFCLKTRPESSKLPLLDVPVSVLFSLLSFDNVMLFISAILCERKVREKEKREKKKKEKKRKRGKERKTERKKNRNREREAKDRRETTN